MVPVSFFICLLIYLHLLDFFLTSLFVVLKLFKPYREKKFYCLVYQLNAKLFQLLLSQISQYVKFLGLLFWKCPLKVDSTTAKVLLSMKQSSFHYSFNHVMILIRFYYHCLNLVVYAQRLRQMRLCLMSSLKQDTSAECNTGGTHTLPICSDWIMSDEHTQ